VDSYPSSPLPPHVFGVRDKVCVLCCLSTVTLTGVCRREYHMYISKLKYMQKLTEIWTLNPNPQTPRTNIKSQLQILFHTGLIETEQTMLVNTINHWSLDLFGLAKITLIIKILNFRFRFIIITPLLCCTTEAISWRSLKFSPLMEPNFMMWSPTFKPYNMKTYDRGKVKSL